jgi:hypothetical protein
VLMGQPLSCRQVSHTSVHAMFIDKMLIRGTTTGAQHTLHVQQCQGLCDTTPGIHLLGEAVVIVGAPNFWGGGWLRLCAATPSCTVRLSCICSPVLEL